MAPGRATHTSAAFCAPAVFSTRHVTSVSCSRSPLLRRRVAVVVAQDSSTAATAMPSSDGDIAVNHHHTSIDNNNNGIPTNTSSTTPTTSTTHSSSSSTSPIASSTDIIDPSFTVDPDCPLLNDLGIDPTKPFSLSLDEIADITETVDAAGVADFRFEHGDFCLEITRPGGLGFDKDGDLNTITPQQFQQFPPAPVQYVDVQPSEYEDDDDMDNEPQTITDQNVVESATGSSSETDAESVVDVNDPDVILDTDFIVKSDRVGFFFCGAKNKPPLVNVGDSVAFNKPVCIIEQLGQQYVYLSEAAGKVIKVFVEDGDAVEYGTQVMVIRPD